MFERIIADHARNRRAVPAYAEGPASVTYRQMADDIARCAEWLRTRGVGPGRRVALHVGAPYRHWLLFFAIEAHGAVSAAVSTARPLTAAQVAFLGADLVVTDRTPAEDPGGRVEVLDRGWLVRLRTLRPAPARARPRSEDDPACIVLSSGTTGTAKKVLLTRGMVDARAVTGRSLDLITGDSRVLMLLPKHSIGGLITCLSVWTAGGTLCVAPAEVPAEATLAAMRPTLIAGAPSHLAEILKALPPDFAAESPIDVAAGGGPMAPAIAAGIHRSLRGQLRLSYASTEMGILSRGAHDPSRPDPRHVGLVLPGVEVAIRDEAGLTVRAGEIGAVWVRGPHVVQGYLEDPEETARYFRDGWYHPGDLGTLGADGALTIEGRTDDLMNFRGRKLMPATIEDKIVGGRAGGLAGIADAAVFLARAPGSDEALLWIACVADHALDPRLVAQAVPAGIPYVATQIEAIPRNAMGKIERAGLRARAEAGELPPLTVPLPAPRTSPGTVAPGNAGVAPGRTA